MNPADIPAYMAHVGGAARVAATAMAAASTAAKNQALRALARQLREQADALQAANARDLGAEASRIPGLANCRRAMRPRLPCGFRSRPRVSSSRSFGPARRGVDSP